MQGKYNTIVLGLMRQLASSLDRLFPGKRSLLIAACQRNNGIITRIINPGRSAKKTYQISFRFFKRKHLRFAALNPDPEPDPGFI